MSDMEPDSVASKTFPAPGPKEGCLVAGVKYPGSLVLCTAKTRLMVVTKCLFAPGVGQKVSAETKRPKTPLLYPKGRLSSDFAG